MTIKDYKEFFSQSVNLTKVVDAILKPILGDFVEDKSTNNYATFGEFKDNAQKAHVDCIKKMGEFETVDADPVVVFDIILNDACNVSIARKNIQGIVRKLIETCSGAFIIFHYGDNSNRTDKDTWRLSWVKKEKTQTHSTSAKRYTYLCGPSYSCRTIAERFDVLQKEKRKTLDTITKAFDVEALSEEFFKEYKVMYDDIVQWITGQRIIKKDGKWKEEGVLHTGLGNEVYKKFYNAFGKDDKIATKAVRDYVKKLLGRLVFIQFLQKKGCWLKINGNVSTNFLLDVFNQVSTRHQDDFIEKVLERVVYLLLNNENRLPGSEKIDKLVLDVPFLNGGLFEPDAYDNLKVNLPKEFFHNEQYKDEKREQSETSLRDNDKFFTQCGILDLFYQYNFTIDENDPNDAEVGVDPEMFGKIFENLLEDNKDKGAFYTPKEIVQYMCNESLIAYLQSKVPNHDDEIRQFVLEPEKEEVPEKKKILNAIKEVKICEPAIGSGAFPMGLLNLLVSLREKLEPVNNRCDLKKEIIQNNIYGIDIEKGAIDIARLRFWLSIMVDDAGTKPTPLPNFDYKFMQGNSLLECYNGVELNLMKSPSGNLDFASAERKDLYNLLAQYFNSTDHTNKISLQIKIETKISDILVLQGYISLNFSGIKFSGNDQFFLWHTWFANVFEKGGFDIVIGNPPYLSYYSRQAVQVDKNYLDALKAESTFNPTNGRYHSVQFFIDKGLSLLGKNGLCSFIVDFSFFEKPFKDIRKFILENFHVKEIVSELNAFKNVASGQIIVTIDRELSERSIWKKDIDGECVIISNKEWRKNPESEFSLPKNEALLKKIEKSAKLLEPDLGVVRTGVNIGGVKKYFLCNDPSYYPFVSGGDNVQRYRIIYPTNLQIKNKELYFKFDKIIEKKIWDTHIGTPSIGESNDRFIRPKIIIRQSDVKITAAVDVDNKFHCGYSLFTFNEKCDDISKLQYLVGILNSTLITYYMRERQWIKIVPGKTPQIRVDNIKKIPIRIEENVTKKISTMVDQVHKNKVSSSQANTTALERKIDILVYLLYGLTWDEVQTVENSFQ